MLKSKSGNEIEIMFGTGASSFKDYDGLNSVLRTAIESGILGFDTAPSYGTEEILGRCLAQIFDDMNISRSQFFIQSKVDALQMMETESYIVQYVMDMIHNMRIGYLDALLIHWPVPEYLDKTWSAFCKLRNLGAVRYIGICNVTMRQIKRFSDLKSQPEIIQIERNPLRTCKDESVFCLRNNITVQAYSPLCKFHEDIRTSQTLSSLAEKHHKNIGQIVMRWHIDTGVIPIFTSKKVARIKEYADLSSFTLSRDELETINKMNKDYKMYLEAMACPGF